MSGVEESKESIIVFLGDGIIFVAVTLGTTHGQSHEYS